MIIEETQRYLLNISEDMYTDPRMSAGKAGRRLLMSEADKSLERLQAAGVIFDSTLLQVPLLIAHGNSKSEVWRYRDGEKRIPVQEWVDSHDGNYPVLILPICNKKNSEISSKSSVVIHSNAALDYYGVYRGPITFTLIRFPRQNPMRIYVPSQGYIE